MSATYTPGQYVICGGSDSHWQATNAKTITGAKTIASKTHQQAVGGKIEVAEVVGSGDQQRFERVAIKRGYGAWQHA